MMSDELRTPDLPEADSSDEALQSFLEREQTHKARPAKRRGALIALAASAAAVTLLAVAVILIARAPSPAGGESSYIEADLRSTVDESGLHTAEIALDAQGRPVRNGEGSLLTYTPADISEINVRNADGGFTLSALHHSGEATEYTLEGYEDFSLRIGAPDNVANDASAMSFITIASADGDPADFGLDEPRAEVTVSYTDGTSAVMRVGDEAPASAGTYLSFPGSDAVYLVADDAVDSFLYKLTDLLSLTVTEAAATVDDSVFTRLTLSGSHYPEPIVMEPNDDGDTKYSFRVTSPARMYAAPYTAADVAGSIRDLYAAEVAAIISDPDELSDYGLSEPYAAAEAVYPDATIRLRASAPDSSGDVFLLNEAQPRVVYKIQLAAIGWANTSLDLLTPTD